MTAIPCPHCQHPLDMTDCDVYPSHVTYWGEEEAVERKCYGCGASFYLKERVTRTWSVGRTPDEADDIMSDDFDGAPERKPRLTAKAQPIPDAAPPRWRPWHDVAHAMAAKGHTRDEIAEAVGRHVQTVKFLLSPGFREGVRRRNRAHAQSRRRLAACHREDPRPATSNLQET